MIRKCMIKESSIIYNIKFYTIPGNTYNVDVKIEFIRTNQYPNELLFLDLKPS